MTDLAERLARAITLGGPMTVARYMAAANADYYGSRDPLGADGDFVTAPEISQLFGELIGAWATDMVQRGGWGHAHYVELGPGRGTLAADALRVAGKGGWTPAVHFVETSRPLRAAQAARVCRAQWHDGVATLPDDAPLIIIANEFFDALPIEQVIRTGDGWRTRVVACQDTLFLPLPGKPVPEDVIPAPLRDAPVGAIYEVGAVGVAIMRTLAARIVAQGGAILVIDYGHEGPLVGETLQAVRAHAPANPFEMPGSRDLSAHVDFTTLIAAATVEGARAHGPVGQGAFLSALGLSARAATLTRAHPDRAAAMGADVARLAGRAAMGELFQVIAACPPGGPHPAGFDA